jgi:hypothetical protein
VMLDCQKLRNCQIEKGLFRSSFIFDLSSLTFDSGKNKSRFLAALGMTTLYRNDNAL